MRNLKTCAIGALTLTLAATTCLAGGSPPASLPVDDGECVITKFPIGGCGHWGGYGMDPDGWVVELHDTRVPALGSNPNPVAGAHWSPPVYRHPSWTARNLGLVFGLALDGEASPNIYVAASSVYGNFAASPCPQVPGGYGPDGPGAIYKIDGTSGAISSWVVTGPGGVGSNQIPNSGVGLGNVCYDKVHDQFFVTNMEDGLIYRIDPTGTILSTFDPFGPDNGVPGFAPLGERLWAVGVSNNRVYYSVWLRDIGRPSTPWNPLAGPAPGSPNNSVWSLEMTGLGEFIPSTNRLDVVVPYLDPGNPSYQYSSPVSDLAFNDFGEMMLAEHTMFADYGQIDLGHGARDLEYYLTGTTWNVSPEEFYIGSLYSGGLGLPLNSAGGVDYDCDANLWSTGDVLLFGPTIYGLQRVPFIGNSATDPVSTSLHVGVDMAVKGGVGDVECHIVEFCESPSVCGHPDAGDCLTVHSTPGCNDAECCEYVCSHRPYCCAVEWDALCVSIAEECALAPCEVECLDTDIREDEPCYAMMNEGCSVDPPMFSFARCGYEICGETWAENGQRDQDWYRFQVGDLNGDGLVEIRATLQSEFPGVVRIHNLDCSSPVVYAAAESIDCVPGTAVACVTVPPGSYAISVMPETFSGGPILFGIPCDGAYTTYRLEINCNDVCEDPPCPGDIDGDGKVNITDLLTVLANWGACPPPCPPTCPGDVNNDCNVNIADLLFILSNWGPC